MSSVTRKRKRVRAADKGAKRKALAARVATALAKAGVDAVLVGGSVASIYSGERYVTDDLDFVSYKPLKVITPVMEQLGWKMVGNRAVHPKHALYVQFCAPPLAVGREPVEPVDVQAGSASIRTLSPTDCVLDRLMKYYHWNDEQGLEQAVLVARHRKIDLARVREVSRREGKLIAFKVFEARLGDGARSR
jgi:Nucleotidyl transferase of unknown function (DUF2204)